LTAVIFKSALLREFGNLALAVFATLFAITLTTQMIRLLGQAASGVVLSGSVLPLMGFAALNYLPVLLSLTLFISVLMALSRSYRNSEMVIWFAAGLPLTAWLRPVLVFAGPIVTLIAVLSMVLSPWAAERSDEFRRQLDRRDDLARVSPGVFREAADSNRVFFVEAIAGDENGVQNVFISTMQDGLLGVMVSKLGYRETAPNGDKYVVLLNGRRYQGFPGNAEYRVMDFERYALRIETRETMTVQSPTKALATVDLWKNPTNGNLAELLWRIGLPVSALVLSLMAIPLSFANPRASRSINLVFALLTYMIYSNLLSMSQAWVSQGRLSFAIGWWLVHAGMVLILVCMMWHRVQVGAVPRAG
jgi:lipopolysaccharide export system permease protein